MQVTHVCLITPQFDRVQDYYRQVLLIEPKQFQEDYVEFHTPGAIISLYQLESFQKIAPKASCQPGHGGMMLELQVADADQEYTRLQGLNLGIDFILPPTTFPWGNRSIYLRDPDGNLLNIYSLVPAQ
jgi:catechol 2,3-dioxygenase-like lactoylglutathione lyase family enzyme